MSVLECDRLGCEEIMCNHLILDGKKYICNSCFEELLEFKKTWTEEMKKGEIRNKIEYFMNETKPGEFSKCDVDSEFRRLTS